MIQFLLHILGTKVPEATNIADWTLEFRFAELGWIVLLGIAVTLAAVWLYWRSSVEMPRWARVVMTALRVALFTLLLLLMLQPILQLAIDNKVRQGLVVMLDASTSMRIQDSDKPRDASLRATLPELTKKLSADYDILPYAFGKDLAELTGQTNRPLAWIEAYTAHSPLTALGDAVREALRRQRGQSIAGVVLLTDGGNNAGSPPLDAAALARQEGVPLYIGGIGQTDPKDIIVASLFSEDVAFVKDELTVTVRVRSQGLIGERANVLLKLGDKTVAEQELLFTEESEQAVELKFTPEQTGEADLAAVIEARTDETVKDNNAQTKRLRVVDTKVKVLLIEQSPRWEFRYLQSMLIRDRRVELKCLLFEADPGVTKGEDSPYLGEFPKKKEDLYRYDVILLGDVDPKLLTREQLQTLSDYVAKFGGALVMIAGKRFSPLAYVRTPIEPALPIELEKGLVAAEATSDKPIKLELTPAGRESPMLALSDKPEESRVIWDNLPPLFWVARVGSVRPAASVLINAPDPRPAGRDKLPVLVLQKYGLGQTLFMGTDSTWRWRKNVGDKYFTLLWSQVVQRMALSRLLGEAKKTQLSSDKQQYLTGDKVTVYARLYTATYEPVNEPTVKGRYAARPAMETGAMGEREVTLRPLPGQPGMYRGEFVAPAAGAWKFSVERDADTQLDFAVREPRFEFGQTAMNEPLLKEMAAVSGGAFVREDELGRLPELVGKKVETIRTYQEVEVWSSPLVFTLLVLVAGTEWALRKKFHLK